MTRTALSAAHLSPARRTDFQSCLQTPRSASGVCQAKQKARQALKKGIKPGQPEEQKDIHQAPVRQSRDHHVNAFQVSAGTHRTLVATKTMHKSLLKNQSRTLNGLHSNRRAHDACACLMHSLLLREERLHKQRQAERRAKIEEALVGLHSCMSWMEAQTLWAAGPEAGEGARLPEEKVGDGGGMAGLFSARAPSADSNRPNGTLKKKQIG